jgi:hypothetical protein
LAVRLCTFLQLGNNIRVEDTSGEVRRFVQTTQQTWRFEFNRSSLRHASNSATVFSPPVIRVLLGRKQHVRWTPSIRDEHGTFLVGPFSLSRILVELAVR